MTNLERYRSAVSGLQAGEELKRRILTRLEEGESGNSPETISESKKDGGNFRFPGHWGGLAAAACLVVLAALIVPGLLDPGGSLEPGQGSGSSAAPGSSSQQQESASSQAEESGELPRLPLKLSVGGMGFEGLMARDIEELREANPWREDLGLTTLPVFRNAVPTDPAGAPLEGYGMTREEMEAYGEELLAALGDAPLTSEADDYYRFSMEGSRYQLDLYSNGEVKIAFSEPIALPEGHLATQAESREDWAAILESLWPGLADLGEAVGITHPVWNIWGDYTFDGWQKWETEVYQDDSDPVQAILNYNFRSMDLAISGEADSGYTDTLWLVWLNNPDLTQKVGDYPIISLEEARELLLEGRYLTTVPEDYRREGIREEDIALAELVYRTEDMQEYFMPFYRFLVKLPEDPNVPMDQGLTDYGAYYVPAIPEEYLEDVGEAELYFNGGKVSSQPALDGGAIRQQRKNQQ
jgi:hypothetical protein